MTRFKGEEIHNKMENGIKVGPNGQFTTLQTHLPNMYQPGLEPASQTELDKSSGLDLN